MKRILFLSVFAALLGGCIPVNQEGEGSTTDTVGVDSVDNVVVADPELTEPEPEPEPPFTSPDLKFFRVQGHVKKIKEGDFTYHFTQDGEWHPGKLVPDAKTKLKRNKLGQIVKLIISYDEESYDLTEYAYNSDGYVCSMEDSWECEGLWTSKYSTNERGWILTERRETYLPTDEPEYSHLTYTYTKIDDQGNWLKCVVKCREDGSKSTITRKITYWE